MCVVRFVHAANSTSQKNFKKWTLFARTATAAAAAWDLYVRAHATCILGCCAREQKKTKSQKHRENALGIQVVWVINGFHLDSHRQWGAEAEQRLTIARAHDIDSSERCHTAGTRHTSVTAFPSYCSEWQPLLVVFFFKLHENNYGMVQCVPCDSSLFHWYTLCLVSYPTHRQAKNTKKKREQKTNKTVQSPSKYSMSQCRAKLSRENAEWWQLSIRPRSSCHMREREREANERSASEWYVRCKCREGARCCLLVPFVCGFRIE